MSDRKIFFFHLPKAGGTSIISALRMTPSRTLAPLIENNVLDHQNINGRYEEFRGHDVYAGHYGRDVYEAVEDGHSVFTNFRHPVYRIASLYRYFRYVIKMDENALALPHNAAILAAKNLSFDEFISSRSEDVLVYISDFHFRQLCWSPWELRCDSPISVAKDLINTMNCAFVCEYPEQSSVILNKSLGISNIPRLNITQYKGDDDLITAQSAKNILSFNERDLSIYNFAVDRFLSSL